MTGDTRRVGSCRFTDVVTMRLQVDTAMSLGKARAAPLIRDASTPSPPPDGSSRSICRVCGLSLNDGKGVAAIEPHALDDAGRVVQAGPSSTVIAPSAAILCIVRTMRVTMASMPPAVIAPT